MAAMTDAAQLVRQARGLIEECNHVVLDAKELSAPALSETVQASSRPAA
ncbi:hypothetical protein ABZT23_20535 [Streptomyces sp. NPDC005386]